MRQELFFNNILWIDITGPTEEDINLLQQFHLRPEVLKQFLPPIKRPKLERDNESIFLVLHFPVYDAENKVFRAAETDFIMSQKTIITAHRQEIPALKRFFNRCETEEDFKSFRFQTAPHLLFHVVDYLTDECLPMLDMISDEIDLAQEKASRNPTKELLRDIAALKRKVIEFRRAIKPQREVLELLSKSSPIIPEKIGNLGQEVVTSNIHVWNVLDNNKELVESIEETANSLYSAKTNEIVKALTIISVMVLPASLLINFFGMNVFDNVSFARDPLSFLYIFGFIVAMAIATTVYFKRKGWF